MINDDLIELLRFGRTDQTPLIVKRRWWQWQSTTWTRKKISPARRAAHTLIRIRFLFTFWCDLLPAAVTSDQRDSLAIYRLLKQHCDQALFFPIDQVLWLSSLISFLCGSIRRWWSMQSRQKLIRKLFMVNFSSWSLGNLSIRGRSGSLPKWSGAETLTAYEKGDENF